MGEHTPTPWAYRPNKFDDWGWIRGPKTEDSWPLVAIARGDSDKSFDEHRTDNTDPYEANAAFIVKAVNSYDALVNVLTDARNAIASLPMEALGYASDPMGEQIHWPIRDELLHRIDEALCASPWTCMGRGDEPSPLPHRER